MTSQQEPHQEPQQVPHQEPQQEPQQRRNINPAYSALGMAAAVLGVLVLGYVGYRLFFTFPITVEGTELRVQAGTLVSDIVSQRHLGGSPGNLVAVVDHRVLKNEGGGQPYIAVNGEKAAPNARLYSGDVIRAMNGSDVVEPIETVKESLEPSVTYEGRGPIEAVLSSGTPGVRDVQRGAISKEVVSKTVVVRPVDKVVSLSEPPKGAKVIALTFDDGPWPGSTERILAVLKKYNVKATFFMLGSQAKGRPQLARMVAEAGMTIGNHSYNHPDLTKLQAGPMARQVEIAERDIKNATGVTPKYFRPPFGAVNAAVRAQLVRDGLQMCEWNIDPNDWRRPGATAIVARVVGAAKPGAVVLMHDGGGDRSQTVAALPAIIQRLRAKGYVFVTLDYLPKLPQKMG
jgi:peptidoglycan/xylan/chitin deacetylase (PgdA/CDA1 family)